MAEVLREKKEFCLQLLVLDFCVCTGFDVWKSNNNSNNKLYVGRSLPICYSEFPHGYNYYGWSFKIVDKQYTIWRNINCLNSPCQIHREFVRIIKDDSDQWRCCFSQTLGEHDTGLDNAESSGVNWWVVIFVPLYHKILPPGNPPPWGEWFPRKSYPPPTPRT